MNYLDKNKCQTLEPAETTIIGFAMWRLVYIIVITILLQHCHLKNTTSNCSSPYYPMSSMSISDRLAFVSVLHLFPYCCNSQSQHWNLNLRCQIRNHSFRLYYDSCPGTNVEMIYDWTKVVFPSSAIPTTEQTKRNNARIDYISIVTTYKWPYNI